MLDTVGETWTVESSYEGPGPLAEDALTENETDRRWKRQFDKVTAIRGLRDNWDGLGGIAPSEAVIDSAEEMLGILRSREGEPPSRIVPAADGIIIVEWQLGGGYYISAEIETPHTAELMMEEPGKAPEHRSWTWPRA